jgi:hypothetical protein
VGSRRADRHQPTNKISKDQETVTTITVKIEASPNTVQLEVMML